MLRHYDAVGLLTPTVVDPHSGTGGTTSRCCGAPTNWWPKRSWGSASRSWGRCSTLRPVCSSNAWRSAEAWQQLGTHVADLGLQAHGMCREVYGEVPADHAGDWVIELQQAVR